MTQGYADRRTMLALSGAFLAGMAGCTGTSPDAEDEVENGDSNGTEPDDETGRSNSDIDFDGDFPELEFVTDPELEDDLLADQIRSNVAFSLDLLSQLRTDRPDENLFFSPYSVSVALAMTYAGARGETAAEMRETLRYDLPGSADDWSTATESDDTTLHAAFGALESEFDRRNEDGEEIEQPRDDEVGADDDESKDELGFQLSSANAVWAAEDHPFDDAYFDLLEAYYGAGEHLVDFTGSPDEAREEINAWVEAQTNDRIEDLLPEGSVDASTRLVLTNAVYFLAAWKHDFDPANTEPETFTGLAGAETEVEMMHQAAQLRYAEHEGHQLVELPYANEETSMVVILPAEGEFESFEESFSVDVLAAMLDDASRPQVDLAMPKFGIESKVSLVSVMQELGMQRGFTTSADFSGMVDGETSDLFIGDIIHQSFVEVDEEGTEAAAATAVTMPVSAPPDQVELTVDRPFLFYIRDQPTETPLFLGRVVDGRSLRM
ncbi:proteinase inhibitor I4 serpin [Natrialba hulunbeirensis JCM 10989]|uniref:Proteinase inhibitor I4 serpin n=1 Tax=Natrialba hulunbeirensis JCM 10989 TaxID=1227493 RepID=L9ZVV0_9EURY|nr:serpin family protein [Natrialba hulunbeirensis]ELY90201.1 proteinase inhibitor I4 serpin [Natrialba hulunbeirensis JCM 10989]